MSLSPPTPPASSRLAPRAALRPTGTPGRTVTPWLVVGWLVAALTAGGCSTDEPTGRRAVKVATGHAHSCAVLDDATVVCWGSNRWGTLGNGEAGKAHPTPTAVAGLTGVRDLAAFDRTTCAVRSDGAVLCWGVDLSREVTSPDQLIVSTPTPVQGLGPARSVSVGGDRSCAVLDDGGVACWGRPVDDVSSPEPSRVAGIRGAIQVVIGSQPGACAVLGDGTVTCWGQGGDGQAGDGTGAPLEPTPVPGLAGAEVARGEQASCVRSTDGEVLCWGDDSSGLLGTSEYTVSPSPLRVDGLSQTTKLSLVHTTACALTATGAVRCWGQNTHDLLCTGFTDGSRHPRPAAVPLNDVRDISVSAEHACAVTGDGAVWCWGSNDNGQLGDGTIQPRHAPARVALDGCDAPTTSATACGRGDPAPSCVVTFTDPSDASFDASPLSFQPDGPSICCENGLCGLRAPASGDDERGFHGGLKLPLTTGPYALGTVFDYSTSKPQASLAFAVPGEDGESRSWQATTGTMQVERVDDTTVRLEATDVRMQPTGPSYVSSSGKGTFRVSLSCAFRVRPAPCFGIPD